jgi:copper chaperone NosL
VTTCEVRRTTSAALLMLVAGVSVACGVAADGPPAIVVDRTPCSHCGMLVSEPVYAAAYRTAGGKARVFDDIGCLLDAARVEPNADRLRFWFHDAAAGGWIDGRRAVFVSSVTLRTPMGGGLIAFGDRATAGDAAARHQGRVVDSIENLMRATRTGGSDAPARH